MTSRLTKRNTCVISCDVDIDDDDDDGDADDDEACVCAEIIMSSARVKTSVAG